MRPVNAWRFAVSLATREQLQPVLALQRQPFELPHLPRERRLVKLVLDVQSGSFTSRYEICWIFRQLRIRVSIKHQERLPLTGGSVSHEQQLAQTLVAPPHLADYLTRNFLQRAIAHARHASLPRERCHLLGWKT